MIINLLKIKNNVDNSDEKDKKKNFTPKNLSKFNEDFLNLKFFTMLP